MRTISFITANYVARTLKYDGTEDWGRHDQATVRSASAVFFRAIAKDVADAGFRYLDLWTALCHWQSHAQGDLPEQIKAICSQLGLGITSYAGGLVVNKPAEIDTAFAFMKRLGAPLFAGGLWGAVPNADVLPLANDACKKHDVRWAFENHPEKTPDEILQKIGAAKYDRIGVALDTGWCGTQGMDAVEAAKKLRDKLFIVHIKDVKAAGKHDTCALGEGVVPCEKVIRYLVDSKWDGNICIEHEPYDRDPMPEIKLSLKRLKEWLA